MAEIRLTTFIDAPRERVFDLARSIDAHQASAKGTNEQAIAGVTRGLIGLNDEVTWKAKHFGIRQKLTVRVTQFERPSHFQDIMIAGAFKHMTHDHYFFEDLRGTLMEDVFNFSSPFGLLGRAVDLIVLDRYMKRFLMERNDALKEMAESGSWKNFLS